VYIFAKGRLDPYNVKEKRLGAYVKSGSWQFPSVTRDQNVTALVFTRKFHALDKSHLS